MTLSTEVGLLGTQETEDGGERMAGGEQSVHTLCVCVRGETTTVREGVKAVVSLGFHHHIM